MRFKTKNSNGKLTTKRNIQTLKILTTKILVRILNKWDSHQCMRVCVSLKNCSHGATVTAFYLIQKSGGEEFKASVNMI